MTELIEAYWLGTNLPSMEPAAAHAYIKRKYTEGSARGKYNTQIDMLWHKYKLMYGNKYIKHQV